MPKKPLVLAANSPLAKPFFPPVFAAARYDKGMVASSMIRAARIAMALAALLACHGAAGAPLRAGEPITLQLRSGGLVHGELVAEATKEKSLWVLKVADGTKVAIDAGHVIGVKRDSDLEAYRAQSASLSDDAEGHYQLARWCLSNRLDPLGRMHLRRAISINPDHAEARAILGYVKPRGSKQWILLQQLQAQRGLVYHGREWTLPEAAEIEDAKERSEATQREQEKRFRRMVKSVREQNKYAEQSLSDLKGMNHPSLAGVISKELREGNHSQDLREIFVGLLRSMDSAVAMDGLIAIALHDQNGTIRDMAIDAIDGNPTARIRAVTTCIFLLKDKDNRTVNAAASLLEELPEELALFPIVDALNTDHSFTQNSPGMQAGTGGVAPNSGQGGTGGTTGGSFTMGGGGPKTITRSFRNQASHLALQSVLDTMGDQSGNDFGYDENAWLEYLAQQLGGYQGELFRDP
jgi:hypothetical protein